MKKTVMLMLAATLSANLFAQTQLNTSQDSASYAIGVLIGKNLMRQLPPDLNLDLVLKAMSSALKGEATVFDAQTCNDIFTAYNEKAQAASAEKAKVVAEQNKLTGQRFLEENKKRAGVTTTASGLQFEVLKKGAGTESPKATDRVKVHYHGTNIDGSVFDSSVERGEPIAFGLNQVIKGWTEGVQLMHVGDKFKFFIPADLAYGDQSPTDKIKPGSTLVFEVELFEINPKE